jgi:hypothetical protein
MSHPEFISRRLPQKKTADYRRFRNILRISARFFCGNLVRHEACVKYTTYVDARTTRAKMPISLKEVRLIWRKRKIKSSH